MRLRIRPTHVALYWSKVPTFITITALVLLCSCVQLQISSLAQAQVSVPVTTIRKGLYSGIREPLQIVIRSQEQWAAFWARHSSTQVGPPSPPDIDFSAEMVAGVFLGEKSTGGYTAEITRAELDGSDLRFYYRERSPTPGAMVTQALTQPYHLVKLPRHDASPIFYREGD